MARKKGAKPQAQEVEEPKDLVLPVSVVGPGDLGLLIRELEGVDETLLQLGLRQGGDETKMPKTSRLMDQLVHVNKLNLLKKPHRSGLMNFLEGIKKQSPVMHVSFSVDPSPSFLEKLTTWLRREIHPSTLLTVGLQPNIGAGCILRTTNKQFDFSLRQDFTGKRDLLLKQLAEPAEPAPDPIPGPDPTTMEEVAP